MKRNLLLLLCLLAGMNAFAYDAQIGGIYYNFSGDEANVTYLYSNSLNSSAYSRNIVIPESVTYNGKPYSVTSIGDYAFYYCSRLTSITIPNSVTSIGEAAFEKCSRLTSITIPNSVTSIGNYAFEKCFGLTSITIPNSVTSIGNYAFQHCSGLTSITIPNSVTSIGYEAFSGTAWYSNQPVGLVYAGKVAYEYNGTMPSDTRITLEEGTVGIAGGAFKGCSGLTSITIPNSVTSIGGYAFDGCSGLTSITIPNSVTSIGNYAFSNCSGLTSITIPNSVTSIGDYAFSNCSGLTSITIPNSVTSIGNYTFSNCSGLTSVTIGNSVTSIGNYTFSNCSGLTSVKVEAGNTIYDSRGNCNAIIETATNTLIAGCKNTTIPSSVTSIGNYAFSNCSGLTSITIPNSVTSIGDAAFRECSGLTSVTIGNSVTSIGFVAFVGCSSLTAVHIIDLVAWCNISFRNQPLYYAHHLYMNGEEIKNLVIPNGVTSIEGSAFEGCSGLTSITIPGSVTSIGSYAFRECTGLTSVTIGNSVTSIGDYAFNSCNSLTDIYCSADTVPAAGTNAFTNYTAKLHVPTGSVGTYRKTEPWSGFGSNIEGYFITFADDNVKAICVAKWDTDGDGELNINEAAAVTDLGTTFKSNKQITSFDELKYFTGLTSIGNQAFYGCNAMTSIIIPENVTSIGQTAFALCNRLTSVNIPSKVTTIDKDAFAGCTALTAVNITDLSAWCNISFVSSSSQPLGNAHKLYLNGQEITKLSIPNDVIKINNYAFRGCTGLTSVVLSSSVLSIGERCFSECSGLTDVYIPSSMTSVGSYAFYKCTALTDVYCYTEEVPNTNTNAFTSSNYKAATLHVLDVAEEAFRTTLPWKDFGTIEVIRPYISFADQTVKDICIANWDINGDGEMTLEEAAAVTDLGEVFKGKSISSFDELQYFTGLTSISDNAFRGCYGLTSITIPDSVTSIGGYAFYGCSSLTSITIPNGVTNIGLYAFQDCSGLTSITIPNGVTYIGKYTFKGCSGLTSITIPKNVTSIDGYAFSGCMLRSVLIKCSTPPRLSSSDIKSPVTFSQATCNHATLYVPIGAWDTYAFADGWYWFINIRETALEEEQVSEQQAYTLMDAGTFAYSVYDPVNDCIGTINSAGNIDENNPNHSWQMIEVGGMHYLYNIGAKKFVKRNGNSLALTNNPEPIDVANGTDGIVLAEQTDRQWALVSNESLSVEQAIITGVDDIPQQTGTSCYDLQGRLVSNPQKGISILRYSDGTTRKVLVK